MSHYGIRPINRSCGSYGPGHQMHWIQAKKSWEGEQPMIDVSIVVHHDGRVDLEGDELTLTMWNHDPDRLRDVVDYAGRGRAVWKPRFHVLALPGPSGYLFNLAALDQRTPCHPGARQARESPPRISSRGQSGKTTASRCLGGASLPQMWWRARNKGSCAGTAQDRRQRRRPPR
jgi:hypothetical protein